MKYLGLAILMFVAVGTLGCRKDNARRLNQEFVTRSLRYTDELTLAGEGLGTAMVPWHEGGELDVFAMKLAIENLNVAFEDVQLNIAALEIPDDPGCIAFAKSLKGYLDWQGLALLDMTEMAEIAMNENPASESTREAFTKQLFDLNEIELELKRKIDAAAAAVIQ